MIEAYTGTRYRVNSIDVETQDIDGEVKPGDTIAASIPECAASNVSNSTHGSIPGSPINHSANSRPRKTEFFAYPSGFGIRVDSRSHLEVFDKRHRYGKNLRLYYSEWVRLRIDMQFFEWLDSPNIIEIPNCPMDRLNSDVVRYLTTSTEREWCRIKIGDDGLLYRRAGPGDVTEEYKSRYRSGSGGSSSEHMACSEAAGKVCMCPEIGTPPASLVPSSSSTSSAVIIGEDLISVNHAHQHHSHASCRSNPPACSCGTDPYAKCISRASCTETDPLGVDGKSWVLLTTSSEGPGDTTEGDGWIFVIKNNCIYAHEKVTKTQPRFHHTSFFAGADVDAAGMFVVEGGRLLKLFPHSGHYRPGEVHMFYLLHFLFASGVPLDEVQCDAQRLARVARKADPTREGSKKQRKVDAPYMWPALHMLHFLRVKKKAWDNLLFSHLPEPYETHASIITTHSDLPQTTLDMSLHTDQGNVHTVSGCAAAGTGAGVCGGGIITSKSTPSLLTVAGVVGGTIMLGEMHRLRDGGTDMTSEGEDNNKPVYSRSRSCDDTPSSIYSLGPQAGPPSGPLSVPTMSRPSSQVQQQQLQHIQGGATFGGGALDASRIVLYPGKSTYPVNPKLRDDIIRRAKTVEREKEREALAAGLMLHQRACQLTHPDCDPKGSGKAPQNFQLL